MLLSAAAHSNPNPNPNPNRTPEPEPGRGADPQPARKPKPHQVRFSTLLLLLSLGPTLLFALLGAPSLDLEVLQRTSFAHREDQPFGPRGEPHAERRTDPALPRLVRLLINYDYYY